MRPRILRSSQRSESFFGPLDGGRHCPHPVNEATHCFWEEHQLVRKLSWLRWVVSKLCFNSGTFLSTELEPGASEEKTEAFFSDQVDKEGQSHIFLAFINSL